MVQLLLHPLYRRLSSALADEVSVESDADDRVSSRYRLFGMLERRSRSCIAKDSPASASRDRLARATGPVRLGIWRSGFDGRFYPLSRPTSRRQIPAPPARSFLPRQLAPLP